MKLTMEFLVFVEFLAEDEELSDGFIYSRIRRSTVEQTVWPIVTDSDRHQVVDYVDHDFGFTGPY